jgi:hypothetical protein
VVPPLFVATKANATYWTALHSACCLSDVFRAFLGTGTYAVPQVN